MIHELLFTRKGQWQQEPSRGFGRGEPGAGTGLLGIPLYPEQGFPFLTRCSWRLDVWEHGVFVSSVPLRSDASVLRSVWTARCSEVFARDLAASRLLLDLTGLSP